MTLAERLLWCGDLIAELGRADATSPNNANRILELRRQVEVAASQVERVLPHATLPVQLATNSFEANRQTRPNRLAVKMLSHLLYLNLYGNREDMTARNVCLAAAGYRHDEYAGFLKGIELLCEMNHCGFVQFKGPWLGGSAQVILTPLLLRSMLKGYGLRTGLSRLQKQMPRPGELNPDRKRDAPQQGDET